MNDNQRDGWLTIQWKKEINKSTRDVFLHQFLLEDLPVDG